MPLPEVRATMHGRLSDEFLDLRDDVFGVCVLPDACEVGSYLVHEHLPLTRLRTV